MQKECRRRSKEGGERSVWVMVGRRGAKEEGCGEFRCWSWGVSGCCGGAC